MDQQTSNDSDQDVEQSTTRPARAGETGTTRADMDDGADTDGKAANAAVRRNRRFPTQRARPLYGLRGCRRLLDEKRQRLRIDACGIHPPLPAIHLNDERATLSMDDGFAHASVDFDLVLHLAGPSHGRAQRFEASRRLPAAVVRLAAIRRVPIGAA